MSFFNNGCGDGCGGGGSILPLMLLMNCCGGMGNGCDDGCFGGDLMMLMLILCCCCGGGKRQNECC